MTEVAKFQETSAATEMETRGARPADPMVSMIERLVLNPDADLDKLERMLAMKERMEAQSARISFARALSEARAEIPPIIKDATVDYGKGEKRTTYKHETLSGIAKVIDPVLSRYGISYRYRTEQGQGGVRVTCIVQHSDGHSEETSLSGSPDGSGSKNGFQAVGSAVTYLQRYTLKAALGLSAEVDDDAQGASPRSDQRPRDEAQQQDAGRAYGERTASAPTPRQQADRIITAVKGANGDEAALKKVWSDNKPRLETLPDDLFAEVRSAFADAAPKPAPTVDLGDDTIPF